MNNLNFPRQFDQENVANMLANNIAKINSLEQYSHQFKIIKKVRK